MSVFRVILNLLAIGVLGAPLAVALSALSGIGHRWPDILAQFAAPALFATGGVLVVLVLLRLWPSVLVGAVTLGLLAIAVWPQWMPERGTPAGDGPTLSLYSANVLWKNNDVEAIAASVREADADVVILIELGNGPTARIEDVLADYPYRVGSPAIARAGKPARTIIGSRYPLTEIPDRPDGLHAVGAVVRTPLGPVNILGVHLTRPWPYQYQWGQIRHVMALTEVRRDLTGPVIVAGDFNAVSSARIGRQVQAELGVIPAPGFPGTWPTGIPAFAGITIDQVYRSADLVLLERRLGLENGSDHRPVVTRFGLAQP
ncbi:endonuclease/exonuclease/phosphatase family protein [Brevundimonas variabilis]|uniref:Endonuclease/exonuclease/phosphatase (EEP) superfamily protein YafD n=1 Tax=Brevundimonas variabilis TaxID=74312 RepID=A0A7W9FEM7_9CAUL|nr:endonuclease/exonuclease/phosphatase family protein [Brevundimonas variabilis]MBB5746455.1 endonuclease/exonuclease/phosphatase (EEP) superfamily protein YafD [Brevundimonas variabilis]